MESQPKVLCVFMKTGLYHTLKRKPVTYHLPLLYRDDLSFKQAKQNTGLFINSLSFSEDDIRILKRDSQAYFIDLIITVFQKYVKQMR